MRIDAYLFLPGNAAEAMEFYKSVFGGELSVSLRGDVDPSAEGDEREQVVNAALTNDAFHLRACDSSDALARPPRSVALSIVGPEAESLRRLFDALSNGGSVQVPLEKQYWGDTFGMLTDRFGITWQVNIETAT